MTRRSSVLLDGTDRLGVPIVGLLEAGHVLRSRYGVHRSAVVDTLLDFVTLESVEILGLPKHAVVEALARAQSPPAAPFADASIVAMAREAGAVSLASFDRGLSLLEGSQRLD